MKITKEIRGKMEEMRSGGATYSDIIAELGVSKWACIKYLQDVEVEKSEIEEEWRAAEVEAAQVLKKHGFERIIDLNVLCPSAYWDYYADWDYYAEKDGEKWLIDVTINSRKDVGQKIARMIDGHNAAILLKRKNTWEFVEITMKKVW